MERKKNEEFPKGEKEKIHGRIRWKVGLGSVIFANKQKEIPEKYLI